MKKFFEEDDDPKGISSNYESNFISTIRKVFLVIMKVIL